MPIDKVKFPNGETEDIRDSRIPGIDSAPTSGSANLVTSGGVKGALDGYLPLTGGTMSGAIVYPGSSYEIIRTGGSDTTWRGGLKYSWANNTTIALWGKNNMSQFVWHAGTDFSENDVNGTVTRNYDFQVGRNGTGSLEALVGGNLIWHQGNDGSGSGLDADLLDGMDSAAYLPAMAYNFQNGIFVETDCGYGTMLFIRITGNSYSGRSRPIHSEYQAYRYIESEGYLSVAGINYGEYLGPLTLFDYNGHVCFWFEQLSNYETFFIEVFTFEGGWNHVTSVTNAAIPDDSLISYKTVITPTVTYSATKLQTSHTIWGQSFDGTNNVDGVLSLSYASTYRATGIEVTSSNSGEASIGFASTNRTVFGRYADRGFIWGSVAGEIMSLLDNGNIGIGTDTPTRKLSVAGGIGAIGEESMFSNSTFTDPAVGIACGIKVSGGLASTGDTYLSTLSGNVGIGTTSPAVKLDVNGDIRGSRVFVSGVNSYTFFDTTNNRVGIGIAQPSYKLDVWGEIRASSLDTYLQTSQPSDGMLPNRQYALGELSGDTTFSMAAGASGVTNHYFWSFDTGSTAPTITWPATITSWYGGSAPTISASKHYEVSVLDGVAICMEV